MQHHRAVLAGGIEHHRPLALRDYLAQDVDALGLEPLEMAERGDPRQVASPRLPARSRPGGGAGLISGHGRQSGGSPAWLGSSLRDGVYGTADGRAWPPNPLRRRRPPPRYPLMVDTGPAKRPRRWDGCAPECDEAPGDARHSVLYFPPCAVARQCCRSRAPPE